MFTQGGKQIYRSSQYSPKSSYYLNEYAEIVPEIDQHSGIVISLGGPYDNGTDERHPTRVMIHPAIKEDCPDATTEELMELTEGHKYSVAQYYYEMQYDQYGTPDPHFIPPANAMRNRIDRTPAPEPVAPAPQVRPNWMDALDQIKGRR